MAEPQIPSIPSTLTLTEDLLPDIIDWRIGERYKILMEVEQVGMDSSGQGEEPTNPITARFKIMSAKVLGKTAQSGKQKITTNPPEKQDNLKIKETSPEEQMAKGGEMKKKVIERIGERSQTG